ncbi:MAG: restriction endonuclease [Flavobacterium sp.]|nr:restriction endonuclease [Flavobacterium sp.]
MHFENYLTRVKTESPSQLADSIIDTANKIIDPYIKKFSYSEHITGLLLGNVQSGKTSQVFGVISAAADEGFKLFLLLTTDNIYLQQQTYRRAIRYLDDTFNVCGENDEIRFKENNLRKPTIIVIKKNAQILKTWNGNLSSSGFCTGNPLFIIDDEADNASLNTKVNKDEISSINSYLETMKSMSSSSVYLQVTATPQAILLQKQSSGWRPSFIQYFSPGQNYLGGDFFYSKEPISDCIRLTDEYELDEILSDDEYPDNGLLKSLCSFLIATAHLFTKENKTVSNFLIHPSVRIDDHEQIAEKIGEYLNRMILEIQENKLSEKLLSIWEDLQHTKNELIDFNNAYEFIKKCLHENRFQIMVMNSKNKIGDYSEGINIIVGGNSLGRGVTFPSLHTVYYCRRAKSPQADTFWQHCRVFGYDRDKDLIRLYLPPFLFKLFSELNESNNSIIAQIRKNNIDDIGLLYSGAIKPTRSNVIDQSAYYVIAGGTNYFPLYPQNFDLSALDGIVEQFDEREYHSVNLNYFLKILEQIESEEDSDWPSKDYINCVKAYLASKPGEQGILIVRRNRDIGHNTGTLLSPNDRILGSSFSDKIVLTIYRIVGSKEKGWAGYPLWIPNIKFPNNTNFYNTRG